MDRNERAQMAHQTVAIVEAGEYVTATGATVNIAEAVASCRTATQCFTPEALDDLSQAVLQGTPRFVETRLEVHNESTLAGAFRLSAMNHFAKIGVLNFASARHAGGGFLNGSNAQEESLARSSALYACLLQCPDYYGNHRQQRSAFYSDHMIYAPGCPIIRTDAGDLLHKPVLVDFITSAAPNVRSIPRKKHNQIEGIFRQRMGKVLTLADVNRCDALVLGAWGCGVFGNDPHMVARLFADYLLPGQPFYGRFQHIHFAVLDNSPESSTLRAFQRFFGW